MHLVVFGKRETHETRTKPVKIALKAFAKTDIAKLEIATSRPQKIPDNEI
jgi:hypothetical protein